MKKIISAFTTFLLLTLLSLTFLSATAQEIDIEAMSNEELLMLLQSIMLKIDQNSRSDSIQEESIATEANDADNNPDPIAEPEEPVEKRSFDIYKNKKLIVGRMPDSWFIRKPDKSEDNSEENSDNMSGVEEIYYERAEDSYDPSKYFPAAPSFADSSWTISTIPESSFPGLTYEPAPYSFDTTYINDTQYKK